MAYSNTDTRDGGSGCTIWYGDLIDIRQVAANMQDLYIRMPSSKKGIGLLSSLLFNSYFEMPSFFLFSFFVRYNRMLTARDFTN